MHPAGGLAGARIELQGANRIERRRAPHHRAEGRRAGHVVEYFVAPRPLALGQRELQACVHRRDITHRAGVRQVEPLAGQPLVDEPEPAG